MEGPPSGRVDLALAELTLIVIAKTSISRQGIALEFKYSAKTSCSARPNGVNMRFSFDQSR
jgi:hypothetical protein